MKKLLVPVFVMALMQFPAQPQFETIDKNSIESAGNIFIITLDGFRWQEVFTGADSSLIHNDYYTPDAATMNMLYWDADLEKRKKKLLPFFWNILTKKGQLYGNRLSGNKVNTVNSYSISYPGYNEIFTGTTDINVSSNKKIPNPNINVLEYLNNKPAFKGKVVVFTSWDVFPYIFNTERNNLPVNSGYENMQLKNGDNMDMINRVQSEAVYDKQATRYDQLTFLTAKEYIQQHQPRVVYLGLGETDECAHDGRYDLYLEKANQADKMIAELWHWVQTTPGYKDNTTFIITTDHGRGSRKSRWTSHGGFIKGSSETWFGIIGPGIKPVGEVKEKEQVYQAQIARTIAALVGEEFALKNTPAPVIALKY